MFRLIKYPVTIFLLSLHLVVLSQAPSLRIDPPFWWAGMTNSSLQLMCYAENISETEPKFVYPGVELERTVRLENPNYLVLYLKVTGSAVPGKIPIVFEYMREVRYLVEFELKAREDGSKGRQGFGKEDVIYLIMPDRFSNGDTTNDSTTDMLEKADLANPDGRHGGDIKGITEELDYLSDLGVSAIWLNPVLENNMAAYSYHGYAITDFYRVDPRLGTNEDYKSLVEACHAKDIKVIMDMVFNHCGGNHLWIKDLPEEDWVHQFPEFTRSNFRAETVMDPYASDFDRERMQTGWFDKPMPDLNQRHEVLANYLIQNSIWWIEFAGLDGIRMDTYPYSYKDFMARWMQRVLQEYPDFSVVGETWLQKETHTAYWQNGSPVSGDYKSHLRSITDFPMHYALKDALVENEGWTSGLARIYYVLSQDFIYSDPFMNVIFADNHDLTRFYTSVGEDFVTGEEPKGHGYIRENFPGGSWPSSVVSRQSSVVSDEGHAYLRTLLNWRKDSKVIHYGKLKQFVPQDGIYVYFRYLDDDAVMVLINKNKEDKLLDLGRFNEVLKDYEEGKDVITGEKYLLDASISVPSETGLILELE